jgi:hypothetical protein
VCLCRPSRNRKQDSNEKLKTVGKGQMTLKIRKKNDERE